MPGIVGLIGRMPPQESQCIVNTMLRTLLHEKSYQDGTFADSVLGVYVGWVADKDSFAAAQPFRNHDQKVTIVVSGECFNDSSSQIASGSSSSAKGAAEWI